MTRRDSTPAHAVLVAIDIAKTRNEVLIEPPGGRRRRLANKAIGYELDISARTVEVYRAAIMEKLEAQGLSTAVRIAMAAGLDPLEDTDDR
ncbi:LuxR C-terminal-related transcriptional regulator [Phenylobacterium sp. VNQ135]|uniref:LuxR C-terminal-related transcriptional regulator n=1 Tax=Phenylobacterium sp. VNQ135 TaxID=3400922 RepID=UPI003BFEF56D